jgi:hypothetical protein
MSCTDIKEAMAAFSTCVETQEGCRFTTHCVYPSFDPVNVFVTKYGDGYRVHDGAGALRTCWISGRDEKAVQKIMDRHATRYGLLFENECFVSTVHTKEWLVSAILAVANTSASAALEAIEFIAQATEKSLKSRIDTILTESVPAQTLGRDYEVRGKSGKLHQFDFMVRRLENAILLDAVVPHHISIASKYVAFSDATLDVPITKYAVYEKSLEPSDSALMQQVALMLPFDALRPLMTRMPHNGR